MAIASPPKVMVLMERSASQNTIAVTITDIGIATSEISVVRVSIKNKKSTMPTITNASRSTVRTLPMELSMKVACRNCTASVVTPGGKVLRSDASVRSSSRVNARVSTPGCFWMPRITAGSPPNPALPRRGRAANPTSATEDNSTGTSSRIATTSPPSAAGSRSRPRVRITNSCARSSMKPPPPLAEKPRTAASMSSIVTPSWRMRAGDGVTRYSRTSPPRGITCDTPGTASKRGRSTKSAVSRSTIGSASSPASATNIISPMIEEIGPMLGRMSAGSED